MKIVCGALAALLFCVAGAIWYVYQKKAVFLPALFGLCGFPKIKESCYYDGSGHFRPATKEDKVGFFMQHPIFGLRMMLVSSGWTMKTGKFCMTASIGEWI